MDILKYVNSRDIREYLRSTNYEFSASEAAWIVNRCIDLPLDEKISAWNEIMNTMPDCNLVSWSPYDDKVVKSFYSLLKAYIDLEKSYWEDFRKCGDGEFYEYCIDYEDRYHTFFPYYFGPYRSYEECFSAISKGNTRTDIAGYSMRKNMFDSNSDSNKVMFCQYSKDGKLLNVDGHDLKGYDEEEYYRISYLFINMWPDIPVPFKKGDLLRYVSHECQDDEKLTVMNELKTRSKDNIDSFGDEDKDKHLFGYYQTDIGSLCEKATWGHYIDFEYCPEDYLEGRQKMLVSLSHYLKGDIPLECFANDYHLIMLKTQMEDIRSEKLFSRASMDI